jgi:aminopeptidase N
MRVILLLLLTNLCFSQQIQSVDFKSVLGKIAINPSEKTVSGSVIYDFQVLKLIDTIKIDAQNMSFTAVEINGKTVKFSNNTKLLKLFEGYKIGKNTLTFNYLCKPKQALYFVGNNDFDCDSCLHKSGQIWTQGQGKYTSHWFPSFDDVNEKLIFNLDISFKDKNEVVSNGTLIKNDFVDEKGFRTWQFRMKKPMSSYLLMLAIGKFETKTVQSKSGKSLQFFIEPGDTHKFETTYLYSKQMFDFFEKEIGVSFPWQIYKQIPVRDFVYAGMENTSATIFARDFVVDSIGFNDKNYINVNAHELAHQWFGDLITAKSGKHHWLQEGFATYYALLAEKDIYGENHFNHKMLQTAIQLKNASKTDTIAMMNEKASSLSFYQKGAWALRILDEAIGHKKFQKIVKTYLKKYQFRSVETADFMAEINIVCDFDTARFQADWLEKSGFDYEKAKEILSKNESMKQYFEVLELSKNPFATNKTKYTEILKSAAYFPIKELVIVQIRNIKLEDKIDLLRLAMQTNDIQVRQAVARYCNEIPTDFKSEYESFLEDKSYITREIALSKLWQNYPEDRFKLLNRSKEWIGFNDMNLRILWLNLALQTDGYEQVNKIKYYDELLQFSSPINETEIRQNAFENLIFLNNVDENYLPNLINAATHFKWQFAGFARTKIRFFLKDKPHRTYFENIAPTLAVNERILIEKLLKE